MHQKHPPLQASWSALLFPNLVSTATNQPWSQHTIASRLTGLALIASFPDETDDTVKVADLLMCSAITLALVVAAVSYQTRQTLSQDEQNNGRRAESQATRV